MSLPKPLDALPQPRWIGTAVRQHKDLLGHLTALAQDLIAARTITPPPHAHHPTLCVQAEWDGRIAILGPVDAQGQQTNLTAGDTAHAQILAAQRTGAAAAALRAFTATLAAHLPILQAQPTYTALRLSLHQVRAHPPLWRSTFSMLPANQSHRLSAAEAGRDLRARLALLHAANTAPLDAYAIARTHHSVKAASPLQAVCLYAALHCATQEDMLATITHPPQVWACVDRAQIWDAHKALFGPT